MKKLGLAVAALMLVASAAIAVVTSTYATDDGGTAINHSQGHIIFPYSKLRTATSAKTPTLYTTAAAWPTTFVPESVAFDGGCQMHTLTETPYTGTPSGRTAGYPTYCIIDVLTTSVTAGGPYVYKSSDGGYGVGLCPAYSAMPTTALPAFCYRQAGINP